MQLSALQKSAAQAIVNIFETGSVRGDYGDVTLLRGDTGQLTYGRSQTTLGSGNLYLLIKAYSARDDGALSAAFVPYLPRLEACDASLNNDAALRRLLRDAGDDPVMQEVQDLFFDRVYWNPAIRSADVLGVESALGASVVYDSTVHGSWPYVRDLTRRQFGDLRAIGEMKWIPRYVSVRENWLATHHNTLLHKTVYRMEAFKALIGTGNWSLKLPLKVRGHTITPESLDAERTVRVPADPGQRRLLRLTDPEMSGPDVEWLQERLSHTGFKVARTGSFDKTTDTAVREFQENNGLKVDGLVGPVTRSALEDITVLSPIKALSPDDIPMPAMVISNPVPTVPMAPDTQAGAQPASAPAASSGSEPVAGSGDVMAELKQHLSDEVQRGFSQLQEALRDQHGQLSGDLAKALKDDPAKLVKLLQDRLGNRGREIIKRVSSNGKPITAAGVSAALLGLSEWRDALLHTPIPAAQPIVNTLSGYLAWLNRVMHMTVTSIPGEWIFRIRIAAIVLIVYAIYRLARRHLEARQLARNVNAILE